MSFFENGKVNICLGAQFGSESKGLISAYLAKNNCPRYLLTANSRNASHTVRDSGTKYVFKILPSGMFYYGYLANGIPYEPHAVIGPGSAFVIDDLLKEMHDLNIPKTHVHIHPNAGIVTQDDIDFENGVKNFEGDPYNEVDPYKGTSKHGTTGSGSGACRAKKSLRKTKVAKDYDELKDMIYDPLDMIIELSSSTALMDGSQGHFLSLYSNFYPNCTSRATTVGGLMSDMDLPPNLIGNIIGVNRTMPIRINSKRYLDKESRKFLTWDEVQIYESEGKEYEEVDSYSGDIFKDSEELTWEEVSRIAGYDVPVEMTTLTKLPRRIMRFSTLALEDFIIKNMPPNPFKIYLAFTFLNYVGSKRYGDEKMKDFIRHHNLDCLPDRVEASFWSHGPSTDSVVFANV